MPFQTFSRSFHSVKRDSRCPPFVLILTLLLFAPIIVMPLPFKFQVLFQKDPLLTNNFRNSRRISFGAVVCHEYSFFLSFLSSSFLLIRLLPPYVVLLVSLMHPHRFHCMHSIRNYATSSLFSICSPLFIVSWLPYCSLSLNTSPYRNVP